MIAPVDLVFLSPFFFLIFFSCCILCFGFGYNKNSLELLFETLLRRFLQTVLFIVFLLVLNLFFYMFFYFATLKLCNSLLVTNVYVLFIQSFFILVAFLIIVLTRNYNLLKHLCTPEHFFLLIVSISGGYLLVSSNSMVLAYLSLELQTLPIYVLIALFKKDKRSIEASLKYFILSLMASMFLIFGFALIYCVSGLLSFDELCLFTNFAYKTFFRNSAYLIYKIAFLLGIVFVIVAVSFKLGASPVHFWVPEIYEAAPTSVVAFLATVPKIAAFGFLINFYYAFLGVFSDVFVVLFLFIGLFSVVVGSIGGLLYVKITKVLAFSGIGQIGFVYLALASKVDDGILIATFYFMFYIMAVLLFFIVWLNLFIDKRESITVFDMIGLASQNYYFKLFVLVSVLSLAGMPPLAGFVAKLLVIKSMLGSYSPILAVLILLLSAVAFVYYLRFLKIIYFSPKTAVQDFVQLPSKGCIFVGVFLVVFLTILPFIFFIV